MTSSPAIMAQTEAAAEANVIQDLSREGDFILNRQHFGEALQ